MLIWQKKKGASLIQQQHCSRQQCHQKNLKKSNKGLGFYGAPILKKTGTSGLERVKWISSTKCYVVHVDNMKKYYKHFFPIDNHVDMKHEDIIARGARVYYKDLRDCLHIDRSHNSTIGHSNWGQKKFFSKRYPTATTDDLKYGW